MSDSENCEVCGSPFGDGQVYDIDCGSLLTGVNNVCSSCYSLFDEIRTRLFEDYVYNDGEGACDYNNYSEYPIHPLELLRIVIPPTGPLYPGNTSYLVPPAITDLEDVYSLLNQVNESIKSGPNTEIRLIDAVNDYCRNEDGKLKLP